MPEKCVQGICLEVPDSFHCLVVHVEYECGHKPQGKGKDAIPATIKLKGDVNPHAGPCGLPILGSLQGCEVEEMKHQIPTECPPCEISNLVAQGLDMQF
ncbi:hypothetical protein PGQ11_003036 [Apiospora arundinis]|uniref:Uncharacterized protein n=1 Tax=Apiospora arundinis TaxID=335852 RepID=A0ABR2J4E9_9PEZI